MKQFLNKITLNRNARGCYILDTIKGCKHNCYGDCYAKKISQRYGFDFSSLSKRDFNKDNKQTFLFDFYDTKHENKVIEQISKIKMPFVRIGEMGDCSEDWEHTINICRTIAKAKKNIVIITKHWKELPDEYLEYIKDVCINTSISALDEDDEIEYRLKQYNRLKKYCKSVLRIVSCNFNQDNYEGLKRYKIQKRLFKNENVLDTAFRPSLKNPLVVNKVINISRVRFMNNKVPISLYNKNNFLGHCYDCKEMCGINT